MDASASPHSGRRGGLLSRLMSHHPASITEIVTIDVQLSTKLFRWNLFTAIFHLVTSIVLFAITNESEYVLLFTTYPGERGNPEEWVPEPANRGRSVTGFYSGVFLLLAAIDHLLMATLLRQQYENFLRMAQNPFRWIEYSLSASVMRIQIAQLCGVLDLHLNVAIFGLSMTTMLFGLLQEMTTYSLQGQPDKKSLFPYWCGFIPHVFSWAIISSYFFQGVATQSPPSFVWCILFVLFFLDLTFAINMFLQAKEIGKWRSFVYGEFWFIVLSLTAKQLLAWINYGGARSLSD